MGALAISIVECAPRLFAYVRRQATLHSMPAVAAATPVWGRVFEQSIPSTDRAVAVFHDAAGESLFSDEGFLVDIGVEVLEPLDDDPILKFGTTPSGRAATLGFSGPYGEIEAIHRAIRAWCDENGEVLAGPVWEIHAWNEDPALLHTQVHYLLA
jgi:effector-binding domain-containing protein